MQKFFSSIALIFACLTTSCVHHAPDLRPLQSILHNKINLQNEEILSYSISQDNLTETLTKPLDLQSAIQIALINNSNLKAAFIQLNISKAQLLQASLPQNPAFAAEALWGENHTKPNLTFSITQNIASLFWIPLKRSVAQAEIMASQIKASEQIVDMIYQVTTTYYEYQAALQNIDIFTTVLEATLASTTIAQRLYNAGNITKLDFAIEQVFYEEAKLSLIKAEIKAEQIKAKINTLLQLSGEQANWTIANNKLNPPPKQLFNKAYLEQKSLAASLTLKGLKSEAKAKNGQARIARAQALLPELNAGVSFERDDEKWKIGPTLSIDLPLFDFGQAEVSKAKYQIQQTFYLQNAYTVKLQSYARTLAAELEANQQRVSQFETTILPLYENIIEDSQKQFNAMQIGVFELINAKKQQIATGKDYVQALLEYWKTHAKVEQLLSGKISDEESNFNNNIDKNFSTNKETH